MRTIRIAKFALAAALALIIPLESAHCAFMRFEKRAVPGDTDATASHECCASAETATTAPTSNSNRASDDACSSGCACFQLPAGIPTSAIAQIDTPLSATSLILPSSTSFSAPRATSVNRVAALDVGNPALPDDPGAHGLRAPPVSA